MQEPFIVASSNWYRPLVFGLIGLAVGLGLTLIIAIASIFRAMTRKSRESAEKAKADAKNDLTNQSKTDNSEG